MAEKLKAREVNSWDELKERVVEAAAILNLQKDEEMWYRGVSNRQHQLLPSLFRTFEKEERTRENIRERETDLFFEFLAKARTGDRLGIDHWDALFLMQHYRAPTRLLDWTDVLYVALYFAVAYLNGEEREPPRLYLMNPYSWNEEHEGNRELYWPRYFGYDSEKGYFYEYGEILTDNELDWEYPVALYPPQREARLSAQHGYFTIHGTDSRPLDEISPKLIVAIDLMPCAVKETKEALEYSGINEYTLFPDLEGLARYLKKKYRIH